MPKLKAGRPRALDRNKKQLLCDAVARGATMGEAAQLFGVSLRTVQRQARLDPDFDQQLRIAHTITPDPLAIMHSAARTHWRAAAWLLERTNPEDYGRRPASSCSPFQFDEALRTVVEAALELTASENQAAVYARLNAACETAFKAVFPNYGPCGRRLVERLPNTPLADAERLAVLRIIPDRMAPPTQACTASAQPRHDGRLDGEAATHPEENHREENPRQENLAPHRPQAVPDLAAANGSPSLVIARSPSLTRNPTLTLIPAPTPAPTSRLPWRYILRAARTSPVVPGVPITASTAEPPILSLLSPKAHAATESEAGDTIQPDNLPHSAAAPNPVE